MIITQKRLEELGQIYGGKPIAEVCRNGRHLGVGQAVKSCISSLFYWNSNYDKTNLRQYQIEWGQGNGVIINPKNFKDEEDKDFFQKLGVICETTINGKNAGYIGFNARHIAQLIVVFKDKENEELRAIFAQYAEVFKDKKAEEIDNSVFMAAIKKLYDEGNSIVDVDSEKVRLEMAWLSGTTNKIKNETLNGFMFEITCFVVCELLTRYYPELGTISPLLFEGFVPFFIAGCIASLSEPIVGGFLAGAWGKLDGSILEMLKGGWAGLCASWDAKVREENTLHPIVEALLGSVYFASVWLHVDQLQRVGGPFMKMLMKYKLTDYVLKYIALYVFFGWKNIVHKEGTIFSLTAFKAMPSFIYQGVVRGFLRNWLKLPLDYMEVLQAACKERAVDIAFTIVRGWYNISIEIIGSSLLTIFAIEKIISYETLRAHINKVLVMALIGVYLVENQEVIASNYA